MISRGIDVQLLEAQFGDEPYALKKTFLKSFAKFYFFVASLI